MADAVKIVLRLDSQVLTSNPIIMCSIRNVKEKAGPRDSRNRTFERAYVVSRHKSMRRHEPLRSAGRLSSQMKTVIPDQVELDCCTFCCTIDYGERESPMNTEFLTPQKHRFPSWGLRVRVPSPAVRISSLTKFVANADESAKRLSSRTYPVPIKWVPRPL
jgi:hypothetical protein